MTIKKLLAALAFLPFLSYAFSQKIELVKDIDPDGHANPNSFFTFKDKLYFQVDYELWATDGSEAGTEKVDLPLPNNQGPSRYTNQFIEFDGKLFITAYDTIYGEELWVMEEEEKGFELFTDIDAGHSYSYITDLAEFKGKLYFWYNEEIWTSNGTRNGTQHLLDMPTHIDNWLFALDDQLYLKVRTEEYGTELWVTDGTIDGTHIVKDIAPGTLSSHPRIEFGYKDWFFFDSKQPGEPWEFWMTDGTEEGTDKASNILPLSSGFKGGFYIYKDILFFNDTDSTGRYRLWASDGTVEGTHLFFDDTMEGKPSFMYGRTVLNDLLYFSTTNAGSMEELWVTDGSPEATKLVFTFPPEGWDRSPISLKGFNGRLYFFVSKSWNNCQNWTSDGTINGTYEIMYPDSVDMDCPIGGLDMPEPPCFNGYHQLGNSLFFAARFKWDSIGCELYKITLPHAENYKANKCGNFKYLLYPNPASDQAKLLLETKTPTAVDVRLFDTSGRLVGHIAKEKWLEIGIHEIPINLDSNYAQGIYFLEISCEGCREWLKLNIVY